MQIQHGGSGRRRLALGVALALAATSVATVGTTAQDQPYAGTTLNLSTYSSVPEFDFYATLMPEFEAMNWNGYLVPTATPAAAVTRINSETVKVLQRPDVKAALNAQGLEVISGTPEQFTNHIKTEIARMSKIAASAGIKAD